MNEIGSHAGQSAPSLVALHIFPVKSCRGIALNHAQVLADGLRHDREWMVVDAHDRFLSQRECPAMARIDPTIDAAAGLLRLVTTNMDTPLELPLQSSVREFASSGTDRNVRRVMIWRDAVDALDVGDEAAAWISAALKRPARMVRFPSDAVRACNPRWAKGPTARSRFSDGYPFLLIGSASIADLRSRMPDAPELPIDRFRANLVIAGVPAYEEDFAQEISIGSVAWQRVKPCSRCDIPAIDQRSGERTEVDPLETLLGYRFDHDIGGAALGQNLIVVGGIGESVRINDRVTLGIFK